MGHKLLHFVSFFQFLTMCNTIVGAATVGAGAVGAGAGAVGARAGATSCYGSDSGQNMRLRLRNTKKITGVDALNILCRDQPQRV
jgi:hypothetical protein